MNRPTEQRIRDYLNRLSLAAKTRLEPDDRQALLDHTRARIDAGCGGAAHPTAEQVRRTLAGLGDPIALVENERSRIAARRAWAQDAGSTQATTPQDGTKKRQDAGPHVPGDAASASRGNGSPRQVWPPPATPVFARQPFMPPVVIPPASANTQVTSSRPATRSSAPAVSPPVSVSQPLVPGRPVQASQPAPPPVPVSNAAWAGPPVSPSQVPASSPSQANPVDPAPADGSAQAAGPSSEDPQDRPRPARPTSPAAPRGLPPLRGVPAPREVPGRNEPPAGGGEPAPQRGAGRGAGSNAGSNGVSSGPAAPRPSPEPKPAGASSRAGGAASGPGRAAPEPGREPGGAAADEDQPGIEFSIDPADLEVQPSRVAEIGDAALRQLRRLGSALLAIARRDRFETVSLLLLGIGGAICPPIWLIGAIFAVSSRKWDLRDKWLGLALPAVVVMIGAALAVALGTHFEAYRQYLVEAWVAAGRLSRVAAVFGALFLLWRLHKHGGSRIRRLPPWSPQRKPGR